jgi:hypothetical protein
VSARGGGQERLRGQRAGIPVLAAPIPIGDGATIDQHDIDAERGRRGGGRQPARTGTDNAKVRLYFRSSLLLGFLPLGLAHALIKPKIGPL